MGGCNSASAGHLVRSVEQRCAGRRAGSSTSSSSSASSSPLPAHGAQCRETSSKENAAIKQAGGTNWRPERPEREQSGAGGAVRKKVEEEGCRLVGAREAASLAQRKREENTAAPMEEPWRGKDREQEEERRKRFEKLRGKFIAIRCMIATTAKNAVDLGQLPGRLLCTSAKDMQGRT